MRKRYFLSSLVIAATVSIGATATAQAQTSLINFDFEDNNVANNRYQIFAPNQVNGWNTTDRGIEIWGDGFNGVSAASGDNFAEINAHIDGILSQDLTGINAGQQIDFSFYHRARAGTDVMNFAITDAGADNQFGSNDDTVLFTQNYSATTAAWELNDSSNLGPITALGNDVRVSYAAVSTGSRSQSVGNFLDRAEVGVLSGNARPVPFELESSAGLLLIGGLVTYRRLKKKLNAPQPLLIEE